MKKLINKTWGSLTEEEKTILLLNANCVDGISGNDSRGGDCIIDLTDALSVSGKLIVRDDEDVIQIEDDAIIYSPVA